MDKIMEDIKESAELWGILDAAEKYGVTLVGIGKRDKRFKNSKDWPFDERKSLFADGRCGRNRPVAWAIAKEAGIANGCGNSGQYQIKSNLEPAIWIYENGSWKKE